MPIYENINGVRKKARLAVYNNKYLKQIYYGNKLVFQMNNAMFESNTPGTYTITIPLAGYYSIQLVGGGGGGSFAHYNLWEGGNIGGSGAMCDGVIKLDVGVYTIVVGSGGTGAFQTDTGRKAQASNGGDTTFYGISAGGGSGSWTHAGYGSWSGRNGDGGTYVVSGSVSGQNGISGSTTGWINNYGAGGGSRGGNGTGGYAKIQFLYYE